MQLVKKNLFQLVFQGPAILKPPPLFKRLYGNPLLSKAHAPAQAAVPTGHSAPGSRSEAFEDLCPLGGVYRALVYCRNEPCFKKSIEFVGGLVLFKELIFLFSISSLSKGVRRVYVKKWVLEESIGLFGGVTGSWGFGSARFPASAWS